MEGNFPCLQVVCVHTHVGLWDLSLQDMVSCIIFNQLAVRGRMQKPMPCQVCYIISYHLIALICICIIIPSIYIHLYDTPQIFLSYHLSSSVGRILYTYYTPIIHLLYTYNTPIILCIIIAEVLRVTMAKRWRSEPASFLVVPVTWPPGSSEALFPISKYVCWWCKLM